MDSDKGGLLSARKKARFFRCSTLFALRRLWISSINTILTLLISKARVKDAGKTPPRIRPMETPKAFSIDSSNPDKVGSGGTVKEIYPRGSSERFSAVSKSDSMRENKLVLPIPGSPDISTHCAWILGGIP